jgi:hypothetical protein
VRASRLVTSVAFAGVAFLAAAGGPARAEPGSPAVASAPPAAVSAAAIPEDLAPGSPAALLDRAFRNLYGDDFVQVMTLSTWRRGGRSITRRAQLTRKQSARPGKAMVRFLEPQEIRRTGVLIVEQDDRYDDFFVYLPALAKVRRLVSGQRADAFFGTDLCYEDVEPKHASDWDVRQVGAGEEAGTPCVVLDIRPKPQYESTYERMESCIEPERAIILRTDFYRRGQAVKQLRVDVASVRELEGRHIPFSFRMETPEQRSSTHVGTESYEIRAGLPDQIFTTTNLEAGDADGDRRTAAQTP